MALKVNSPSVRYSAEAIEADFLYQTTDVRRDADGGGLTATPRSTPMTFRTERRVPSVGLMLVGWGGNNGSTVTASVIANRERVSWMTKDGEKRADYLGSITQSSTVLLGNDPDDSSEVYVPMKDMLPMVDPNALSIGGWDISGWDLGSAMERARVLPFELQRQLRPHMSDMRPLPSVYDRTFIAANQEERADNVMEAKEKWDQVETIRRDIREFK